MPARVTHVTSVHDADDPRINSKECRTLAAAGFRVSLLAPEGSVHEDGPVSLVPLPAQPGRLRRMTLGNVSAFRRGLRLRSHVYHLHDPELFPTAVALRLVGRRVVMDVHEDLPAQIRTKTWIAPALRRPIGWLARRWEWAVARIATRVVVAEPGVYARFPAERATLIQNFPRSDEFPPASSTPYGERPNHLVYVGSMSEARGLFSMIRAVDRLDPALEARLHLAGQLSGPLRARAEQEPGWRLVVSRGWLGRDGVADVLGEARIGMVVLHPLPNYVDAQPTKLFEYMMAGLPVVASDFPRWREIIEPAGCGLLVDPMSEDAIVAATAWLLEHPEDAREMGERGRAEVLRRYSWDAEGERLVRMYETMLGAPMRAPSAEGVR
ncbi:MAG TPA: glycosyltransferase family 4 protein [Actinomycetota bacterium]|nr:glycosyltransferase family 4 protein [Actinomycetota bacterium]